MKNIKTLPNIVGFDTFRFVFLSIITLGVFPLIWLYNVQKRFYAAFEDELWEPIFPLVLPAITGLLYLFSNSALLSGLPTVSFVLDLVDALIIAGAWIYWSFVMRNALIMYVAKHHQFELKINLAWLILFSYLYIVYVINKLPREQELAQALTLNKD